MAERAFVLINTGSGVDDDILVDQLKKIEGISEAYRIYGIYDILVKIEARTIEQIREVIGRKLKNIRNIKSTITMVAIPSGQVKIAGR
jgi:DNA-binding Lrp family transcriptional regulator